MKTFSQREKQSQNITVSSVKYDLREDPFVVPIKFKKEVPLNKTIFELNQPLPKNYANKVNNQMLEQNQMHDPVSMNSASIKVLLLQKMNAYVSIFSILISIFELYFLDENDQDIKEYTIIICTCITGILIAQICATAYFHHVNELVRHFHQNYAFLKYLTKLLIVLLAPNIWTLQTNKFFHLTLLLRVYFPITYSIKSSMYNDPRSARITKLYGIKPEQTLKFALKVILNQESIMDVVKFYFGVVIFYSHCLFVISDHISFIDCFEVVIATLPTIGYGEHQIKGLPRIIVLFILLTGVPLNAFVTFVMLKHFQMTTSQKNSYILMQKLKMVEEIKSLSSNFIIDKIKHRKVCSKKSQENDVEDNFKEKFLDCKARYRNLNPQDSIYQFNYFKEMLNDVKVKVLQTNNMANLLLAKLSSTRKADKKFLKFIDKNE